MANDGKIYITISDRRFGRNKAEADEQNKVDKEKEQSNPLKEFIQHKFFNLVESQAKQAVNYTIGNIGNFTGNYMAQTHVSEAVQGINFLINVGTSAYAGFKMSGGNPYGALIAAGITVATSAISVTEQYFSGLVDNARRNQEALQLRTRAGLNSANNGSRGTEY